MLINTINDLIAKATISGDRPTLEVLKLIKCELVRAEKDGIKLTETVEAKILLKMLAQREESASIYDKAGRKDLADKEREEMVVIKKFAPAEPDENEISEHTLACIAAYKVVKPEGYNISMRDMKPILELVHEKYPNASGKIVSKTLQNFLK